MGLNELSIICNIKHRQGVKLQNKTQKKLRSLCAFAPLRLIFFFSLFLSNQVSSQYIPVHPQSNDVYSFLDEFSLPYNAAIKPLGRLQISELLHKIDTTSLTLRQQKELTFYLKDFNKERYLNKKFPRRKDLFYYRDSSFSITVNPILGSDLWANQNGFEYHLWNGAEAWATIGNWGIYGSLRDNHESSSLFSPNYLDQYPGGSSFKVYSDGKVDFEEIRGGVTYSWKTGSIGLLKDNPQWGTNYYGANIFSGRTPAFTCLDLHINPVKWFDFHYIHGWLNSQVIDSTRSFNVTNGYGTNFREVYHSKFLAANMFTFYPVSRLALSFGNSIIYDYDKIHPAYLIPVMFFKAIDHSLNSGIQNMNSQMFIDISSKNFEHFHIYSTLFIDELAVKRIVNADEHNFVSFKAGVRISNLVSNTFAGIEYTITNALTFKHIIPTTTFESNRYNLGHYLTDNAQDLYLTAGYKPYRNLVVQLSYNHSLKGPDHTSLGTMPRDKIKPFTPIVWEKNAVSLNISWQPINDLYLRLGYEWRNITGDTDALEMYTSEFWWGKTGTMSLGVNFGF